MHTVLAHPLVKHRVTLMRDINTKPKQFRELVNEITEFLAIESLKDLRTVEVPVVTPVAKTTGVKIEDQIVIVPILRAGMGMLDAMLHVLPYAKVGVDATYMLTDGVGLFAKLYWSHICDHSLRAAAEHGSGADYGQYKDFAWGGVGVTFEF